VQHTLTCCLACWLVGWSMGQWVVLVTATIRPVLTPVWPGHRTDYGLSCRAVSRSSDPPIYTDCSAALASVDFY